MGARCSILLLQLHHRSTFPGTSAASTITRDCVAGAGFGYLTATVNVLAGVGYLTAMVNVLAGVRYLTAMVNVLFTSDYHVERKFDY